VRHGREIADDRLAVDILTEGERDLLFRRAELGIMQQFVKGYGDFLRVGDFDAYGVFTGNGG
jgi:hypothetical protein